MSGPHRCLEWPAVVCPVHSIADNASRIRELADSITSKKNYSLPEWKRAQFNGHSLQWHEWYSQFKSAIGWQLLTCDVKLTNLETLVTGRIKIAIAYCCLMYKDALRTLHCKFGRPQAVISAHLVIISNFPPLQMQNSDNIINFSAVISSLLGFSSHYHMMLT